MSDTSGRARVVAQIALATSLVSFPLFIGLVVLTTAPNPAYPSEGVAWFSLLVPVAGIGMAVYALIPQRGVRRASGRALAALLVGVVSFALVRSATRFMLDSRTGELEMRPIGELRSLISAEEVYASANGGRFGEPACLVDPASCIPGYQGPPYLGEEWVRGAARGNWRFEFRPGGIEGADAEATGTGIASYTCLVLPARTRQSPLERLLGLRQARSYCGDSTGRICRTAPGQPPVVVERRCAPEGPGHEHCFE